MLFVLIAVVLAAMKYFDLPLVDGMSWWWLLLPLGLAFVWWEIVDPWLGLTKKRVARNLEQRKADRIARQKRELRTGLRRR